MISKETGPFDNRSSAAGIGLRHFWFNANGKKVAYCYIRKNACSAFKQFICRTSEKGDFLSFDGSAFRFMRKFHTLASDQIGTCDEAIFVYRDPYDRLISTYINKFVQRTGNKDITGNFAKIVEKDPNTATFREFAQTYARSPFEVRDPHIRPQFEHLAPIRYSRAVPLMRVAAEMADLVGPALARRYFAKPTNATRYGSSGVKLYDTPSDVLHAAYLEQKTLPSKESLSDPELRAIVGENYAADMAMLARMLTSG